MSEMEIATTAIAGIEGVRGSPKRNVARKTRLGSETTSFLVGLALFLGMGLSACSDDDNTMVPPDEFAPPTNLSAANGNSEILVQWAASPDEGSSDFSRYNVYRGTSTLMNVEASQLDQLGYKIGSVGSGVDSFSTTVANGTLYFFHVRAEKDNGNLSATSNEVQASARPEGAGRILEEFAANGESGFDFSTGLAVSLNQDNAARFTLTDIYLGTGAVDDASTSGLSLKSPAFLVRLNSEWTSQIATIKFLGTDWDVNTTSATGFGEQTDVLAGAVYAIRTPDGNYAKLGVDSISGEAGSRSITFRYAFQPTPNLIQF